jgi:serine/threonine-protein kinase
MAAARQGQREQIIDRYAIYDKIAAGGMAVVHLGRLLGQAGFSRTVAVKRLHPQFASDPEFVAMFLDEAHLAVRVQHPNVVAPLDVVVADGELLVVMEYVSGETLSQLMRATSLGAPSGTVAVLASIMVGTLYGLHAAHEARGENGQPLNIVHRDVSPQNIIVGLDGVPRVLDFGVAKAAMRSHATKEGEIKGKIAYMSPDQLRGLPIDRRADIFAAGVVFWEALTSRRLFRGDDLGQTVEHVLHTEIATPSEWNPAVPHELGQVVLRALERDPDRRFATAREFAMAIERTTLLASVSEVADWVKAVGGAKLADRVERVAAIENHSSNRLRVAARSPMLTPRIVEPEPEPISARLIVEDREAEGRVSTISQKSAVSGEQLALEPSRPAGAINAKWLAAVAAMSVALGAAAFAFTRSSARNVPQAAPVAGESVTEGGRARSEPNAAPAPPTAAAQAVGPLSAPAIEITPVVASSKPAVVRRAPALAPKPTAAPPANKHAGCDPPFVIDAHGIRRIKAGCI